jgi:hypothetical protein
VIFSLVFYTGFEKHDDGTTDVVDVEAGKDSDHNNDDDEDNFSERAVDVPESMLTEKKEKHKRHKKLKGIIF